MDWHNVVTIRVNLIATSTQFTTGYVDTKTYNLGLAGVVGPFNDAYKKHLFAGNCSIEQCKRTSRDTTMIRVKRQRGAVLFVSLIILVPLPFS